MSCFVYFVYLYLSMVLLPPLLFHTIFLAVA